MFFALQGVLGETPEVSENEVEGVDVFLLGVVILIGGLNGLLEGFFYGFGVKAELASDREVGEGVGRLV
jgi:hypothetical protein